MDSWQLTELSHRLEARLGDCTLTLVQRDLDRIISQVRNTRARIDSIRHQFGRRSFATPDQAEQEHDKQVREGTENVG